MKIFTLAAAALVAVTGIVPGIATTASAQHRVIHERTVVRHDDRRPGYNHRARTRTVCTNRFRNGHRVRVCRQVTRRR